MTQLKSKTPARSEAAHFAVEDYEVFQKFLQEACGIVLGADKQYLVINRVRRIMLEQHCDTLSELVRRIRDNPRTDLKVNVINAMTTNETFWFRDGFPFEALKNCILPRLVANGRTDPVRIWSAGCSSGQEPYSLSMIIDEFRYTYAGLLSAQAEIIGTDVSSSVLTAARRAVYDHLAVGRGLSDFRRSLYFTPVADAAWQVKPVITSRVEFRALNLLDSFALMQRFDVVFCRNVLIYFSASAKTDILRRMRSSLRHGGYLMLGASESLPPGVRDLYEAERLDSWTTVYRAR